MNDVDRRVIQLHVDTLASETNFNQLLENLSEKNGIITRNLKAKYGRLKEKGETNIVLNQELYKDIQTRGKNAFDILIECLNKTQPHLADLLKPNERVSTPTRDEIGNGNETELLELEGICTVTGNKRNDTEIIRAVRNLCIPIKAKFVSNDKNLTPANFHLAIKADGMFQEEDIRNIEDLYTDCGNLKIIVINIIGKIPDNAVTNQSSKVKRSSGSHPTAVFIVNIHIHPGDHVSSVINIVKEVVANNTGCEIRDIFRMVMEKLSKWCCRLNTESRSFPEFRF